jgi:DNA-binding HxlR family transcriptional regulator
MMSNKTYNQYCAIAHALDSVGERWTLIIVRNLLIGPKRFSDLLKGLPGISTNILTERLKLLEEKGVITTRFLPPPAASTVYQLTESGYALADVLAALARWGSQTLGLPQAEQYVGTEGIAFMVLGVFRRSHYPSLKMNCRLHVQDSHFDQSFNLRLSSSGVEFGSDSDQPDVQIQLDLAALSPLSSGRTQLQTLLDADAVRIEGDAAQIRELIAWVDQR